MKQKQRLNLTLNKLRFFSWATLLASCSAANPQTGNVHAGPSVVLVPPALANQVPPPPAPSQEPGAVLVSPECPRLEAPTELPAPFGYYTSATDALAAVLANSLKLHGEAEFVELSALAQDYPSKEGARQLLCLLTRYGISDTLQLDASEAKKQASDCQTDWGSIRFYPEGDGWVERWDTKFLPNGALMVAKTPAVQTGSTLQASVEWDGGVAKLKHFFHDYDCPKSVEGFDERACWLEDDGRYMCDGEDNVECEFVGLEGTWGLFWPETGKFRKMQIDGLTAEPTFQHGAEQAAVSCKRAP